MIRNVADQLIPIYLEDSNGDPVPGVIPVGSELRISKSGATLTNGVGVWTEVGGGHYTYEPTQAETNTPGFLTVLVVVTGAVPFPYTDEIQGSLQIGEDESLARRVPVWMADEDGIGVTGLTPLASDITVSTDGGAFATGLGSFGEAGGGLYYYQNDVTELGVMNVLSVIDTTLAALDYVYTYGPVYSQPGDSPVPSPLPPIVEPEIVDYVAAALDRLPFQYRTAPI